MSSGTIITIAVVGAIVLGALLVLTVSSRRDARAIGRLSRETRTRDKSGAALQQAGLDEPTATQGGRDYERSAVLERTGGGAVVKAPPPAPPAPPRYLDEDAVGTTRRQFLNRSIVGLFGLGLGSFGAASIAFLWPSLSGGFGSKINAGNIDDIIASIRESGEPFYVPEGRFYINPYPKEDVPKAESVAAYAAVIPGYEAGVVALYQKCVHLGCRVPWCTTSQWFECPCHGSQYNRVGEKKGGPAPRGLDRFVIDASGGSAIVDTSKVIDGPPVGVDTTGQEAEGPHCA